MGQITLRQWLQQETAVILNRQGNAASFIVWCDPDGVWRDLLLAASDGGAFELWADETHELILRERFAQTPRTPRVVWLPAAREGIGYFKVFALQAAQVWEETLPQALSRYGVHIPHDRWHELAPLLPAYAKTWLDHPLDYWRKNFPGPLLDDDAILQILAGMRRPLSDFVEASLTPVFYRRVTEDFGLPDAQKMDLETWRQWATATLLVTDAAQQLPARPPGDAALIIHDHAPRQQALKLLAQWQQRLDLLEAFETLAAQGDGLTSLGAWAVRSHSLPAPLASPAAAQALFAAEIERLAALAETPEALMQRLDDQQASYAAHANAFWGKTAVRRVRWDWLVDLAEWARLLHRHKGQERGWRSPAEAVAWFTGEGWQVDYAGETLFREEAKMPPPLRKARAALRLAYQRHLDHTNQAFSELLVHHPLPELPYAGTAIAREVEQASKNRPVAVFIVDACRYDVGQRLAALLNAGERQARATVSAARAPLPAITAVGMPYALPGVTGLEVTWTGKKPVPWQVSAAGFSGNLAEKSERIKWLKQTYKLADNAFRQIGAVLDGAEKVSVKENGRLLFVFADELDDHEGNLKPHGLDREVKRYADLLRRLRAGGYSAIFVVTDHGAFHWEGDADERAVAKPIGEILYASRRAMVGHGLQHETAVILPTSGSDSLQCATPRSIQAFKTPGGLGFFHGGATLQELIIPVLTIRWPQQMREAGVVLKPVSQITSLAPRLEIEAEGVDVNLLGEVDEKVVGRRVRVEISHSQTGKKLFSSDPVIVEPGGEKQAVQLMREPGAQAALRSKLDIVVRDADSGEILDRCMATLLKEMDEWF